MTAAELKGLYERKARAMTRRPGFAAARASARARVRDQLSCELDLGDRTLRVDLPLQDGGSGLSAHPGQLMRASLGACLAMGYKLWGARLAVPVEAVDVDVTVEYDARGQMGLADVPVGWRRLAVDVTITSPAPEPEVRRLVDTADRLSPMLANLSSGVERVHRLAVVTPAGPR